MAVYNRGGGGLGPGGLPSVFPEDEAQRRKREYLQDLQSQAEADRARKRAERDELQAAQPGPQGQDLFVNQRAQAVRGANPNQNQNQNQNYFRYAGPEPPYGYQQAAPQQRGFADPRARGSYPGAGAPQQGSPAEPVNERERYAQKLRASFDMALDAATEQIMRGAQGNAGGPDGAHGKEGHPIAAGMRRWEDLFVGQVSTSVEQVEQLARRLAEAEGQVLQGARERQQLAERLNRAELAQTDHAAARGALERALAEARREQAEKGAAAEGATAALREEAASAAQRQEHLARQAAARAEEADARAAAAQAAGAALGRKVEEVEGELHRARDDLNAAAAANFEMAKRTREAQEESDALAREAEARMRRLEERVLPATREYVDGAQAEYWAPVQREVAALRAEVGGLRAQQQAAQAAAAEALRLAGEAQAEGVEEARAGRLALEQRQGEQLALVQKALAEESAARHEAEARLRGEQEAMAARLAQTIAAADQGQAALVEMVHAKALARFAEQEGVAAALREQAEGRRAALEEAVRAEVAARFEQVDGLRAALEGAAAEHRAALGAERAEAEAQLKLLQVKVKGAVRAQRGVGAQIAAAAEQVGALRADLDRETAALGEAQARAEEEARRAVQGALGDMQLQLAGLREEAERRAGGAPSEEQHSRDTAQEDAILKLRGEVAELQAAAARLADAGEEERARGEKAALEGRLGLQRLREEAERRFAEGDSRREDARAELAARLDGQESGADALRVQFIDLVRDVDAQSTAAVADAARRAEKAEARVEAAREELEALVRAAEAEAAARAAEVARDAERLHTEALARCGTLQGALDLLEAQLTAASAAADGAQRVAREAQADGEARGRALEERLGAVREVLGEEVRAAQTRLGEELLAHKGRVGRLDAKLAADARKTIAAMQTHHAAVERVRADAEARAAQAVAQGEEQVRRVWAELEAVRGAQRETLAEVQERLKGERLLREADAAGQREALAAAEQRAAAAAESLRDAIGQEGAARAMEGAAALARAKEEALEARRFREELCDRLGLHRAEAAARDEAVRAAAADERARVDAALAERDAAAEALRAQLADAEAAAQADALRLQALRAETDARVAALERADAEAMRACREEAAARDAAVAEVYRRAELERTLAGVVAEVAAREALAAADAGRAEAAARAAAGEAALARMGQQVAAAEARLGALAEADAAAEARALEREEALAAADAALALRVGEVKLEQADHRSEQRRAWEEEAGAVRRVCAQVEAQVAGQEQRQRQALAREVERLSEGFQEFALRSDDAERALGGRVAALEGADIARLAEDVARSGGEIRALQDKGAAGEALVARVEEVAARVQGVEGRMAEQGEALSTARGDLESKDGDLEARLATLDARVEELKTELHACEEGMPTKEAVDWLRGHVAEAKAKAEGTEGGEDPAPPTPMARGAAEEQLQELREKAEAAAAAAQRAEAAVEGRAEREALEALQQEVAALREAGGAAAAGDGGAGARGGEVASKLEALEKRVGEMEGAAADRARVATASPEKSDAGSDEEGEGAAGGEALAKLKKKLKVALKQITNAEDTLHARIDLLKVDDLKKVCNVNSESINKLDERVKALEEK